MAIERHGDVLAPQLAIDQPRRAGQPDIDVVIIVEDAVKIGERIDYARVFVKGGTVFDTRVETVSGLTMTEAADGVTSITVATPLIANDSENCVVELYIAPSQPGSHPTIATGL